MACYHPLKAWKIPGVAKIKFAKDDENLWNLQNEHFNPQIALLHGEAIKVPCGQCIGCRMSYARNWAIRCMLEASLYPKQSCWFCTLTYDDAHVPQSFACDLETGEVTYTTLTLRKRDLQLFFKRFRQNLEDNYGIKGIRYFACGEYGSLSKRPHYHFILFGLPYDDKIFTRCKVQNSGHLMFDCKPIQESWKFGFSPVEDLTFDSSAYVAGYMLKKVKGKDADEYYRQHGLEKEFSVMSRRPGIAGVYFQMYGDNIYNKDSLQRRFGSMDFTPRPPEYFDRLFKEHHPEELAALKRQRRAAAKESLAQRLRVEGLTEEEYLKKEEYRIKSSCISGRSKKI